MMISNTDHARTADGLTLARADIVALTAGDNPGGASCRLRSGRADLSDLDLAGWRFERCTLRRASLARARLEGTQWLTCRAPFASFLGADLTDAVIQSCDFNNADLRQARLTSARLRAAS
jgi:uncharacterized protein YjbI with pentapeptide repeats